MVVQLFHMVVQTFQYSIENCMAICNVTPRYTEVKVRLRTTKQGRGWPHKLAIAARKYYFWSSSAAIHNHFEVPGGQVG